LSLKRGKNDRHRAYTLSIKEAGGDELAVISVMNYKGGVGKTTLSANIAAEMAFRGKKVLLLDLDAQTNLTLSFVSVEEWQHYDRQERTIKHWYDQYLDYHMDASLRELIITPSRVNVQLRLFESEGRIDMICSHLELINVDMELSSGLGGQTERMMRSNYLKVLSRLRNKLVELKDEYDVILIDCPPNFNLVTQNAIVASDSYIVPAKADYLSTLGISTLVRHINELTKKYNHYSFDQDGLEHQMISPHLLGVIFTMISYYKQQPISVQREYIAQVNREEKYRPFRQCLRENQSLFAGAPEYGIPVVLKKGSGQQEQVREELAGLVNEIMKRANIG
jgi:chromosome partitioning protein